MPGHWTAEAREAARQRILQNKPWMQSTGPQSEEGKAISSRNSMTFVNQVKAGLWCYLPQHRIFARVDVAGGKELIQLYQHHNWLYGDPAFLINALNQRGDRWLDQLI